MDRFIGRVEFDYQLKHHNMVTDYFMKVYMKKDAWRGMQYGAENVCAGQKPPCCACFSLP